MTKYTEEVARVFNTAKAPHRGFLMQIIERSDYLVLALYRENLAQFNVQQQQDLALFVINLLTEMQKLTAITVEVMNA